MPSPRFAVLFGGIAGLLCIVAPVRGELRVQPHDVVAVCTDIQPRPKMLSVDVADYFLMCQPVPGLRVVQMTGYQEGVEAFMKRVESDLAPLKPTVVLTTHGIDSGSDNAQSRGLTYYHPTYLTQTVQNLKKIGARTVVIGSSGCVDSSLFQHPTVKAADWNQNLAAFRDSSRQVAEKEGVLFADIYAPMMDAMPKAKALFGDSYIFSGADGRHPDVNGQLVMAYAFLKALGCDGAIGTIKVDLAANKAEATEGHKILSFQKDTVEVESNRYPFCFQDNAARPESATSGIIQAFPFNDELNRYLLIVTGLNAPKARVTWGTQSREFAATDLAKGVNLAAAFAAHTPFDTQFAKVENAVWAQQQPETLFVESFHSIPDFKKMAPGEVAAVDQLATAIIEQDRTRGEAISALVVPIRHTLKIEPIP